MPLHRLNVRAQISSRDENGARSVAQDPARNTPQMKLLDVGDPSGANHDLVGVETLGHLQNLLRVVALLNLGDHLSVPTISRSAGHGLPGQDPGQLEQVEIQRLLAGHNLSQRSGRGLAVDQA
jgi:hypothetical protein